MMEGPKTLQTLANFSFFVHCVKVFAPVEYAMIRKGLILFSFAIVSFFAGRRSVQDSQEQLDNAQFVATRASMATQSAPALEECMGQLGQYMVLANKLFYMGLGAPRLIYWEDPYVYVPDDPRVCGDAFDPIGCAKAQSGTFTFRFEPISDGTKALVPVEKVPSSPPSLLGDILR